MTAKQNPAIKGIDWVSNNNNIGAIAMSNTIYSTKHNHKTKYYQSSLEAGGGKSYIPHFSEMIYR